MNQIKLKEKQKHSENFIETNLWYKIKNKNSINLNVLDNHSKRIGNTLNCQYEIFHIIGK
jgi:hypothetical protein